MLCDERDVRDTGGCVFLIDFDGLDVLLVGGAAALRDAMICSYSP